MEFLDQIMSEIEQRMRTIAPAVAETKLLKEQLALLDSLRDLDARLTVMRKRRRTEQKITASKSTKRHLRVATTGPRKRVSADDISVAYSTSQGRQEGEPI